MCSVSFIDGSRNRVTPLKKTGHEINGFGYCNRSTPASKPTWSGVGAVRGEALGRQVPRGSTAEPWGLSGLCLVQVVGSSASSARLKGRELPQNKLCHRLKGWGTKAVAKRIHQLPAAWQTARCQPGTLTRALLCCTALTCWLHGTNNQIKKKISQSLM